VLWRALPSRDPCLLLFNSCCDHGKADPRIMNSLAEFSMELEALSKLLNHQEVAVAV
jgi:hypothetical protein